MQRLDTRTAQHPGALRGHARGVLDLSPHARLLVPRLQLASEEDDNEAQQQQEWDVAGYKALWTAGARQDGWKRGDGGRHRERMFGIVPGSKKPHRQVGE